MIYIKIPDRLKSKLPAEKRGMITSDEILAFTEQPKVDASGTVGPRIAPHDLFELFTADIIRKKVHFIR
jgi:hypothetical protein